jgi:hypothetical protein
MAFSRRTMLDQEQRGRTHRILIGIILATLPCYFCGIILLFTFSARTPSAFNLTLTALAGSGTPLLSITPGPSPTITPTYTPGGPTVTLPYTPTQFVPASDTPTATNTPVPTDTPAPTDTPKPNAKGTATTNALLTQAALGLTETAIARTPHPTATTQAAPTNTSVPATDTPVPAATSTPAPPDTDTPVPPDTDTPVPPDTATP